MHLTVNPMKESERERKGEDRGTAGTKNNKQNSGSWLPWEIQQKCGTPRQGDQTVNIHFTLMSMWNPNM